MQLTCLSTTSSLHLSSLSLVFVTIALVSRQPGFLISLHTQSHFPPQSRIDHFRPRVIRTNHKMPTGFLNLPAELRLEIYKYLLVSTSEDPIDIFEWSWGDNKELKNAVKLSPNILCTNSKILREASPILYGNNCFRQNN